MTLMKSRIFVALAAVLTSGVMSASAATVDNYLEKFDKVVVAPAKTIGVKYWSRYTNYDYERNTYDNPKEGGQDGAWLKAATGYYSDYLISPEVEGEVAVYGKLTSSGGSIVAYDAVPDGSKWKFTKIEPVTGGTLTTDSWTRMTFQAAPGGHHIAFIIKSAGIDEFSAEKAVLEETSLLVIDKVLAGYEAINLNLDTDGRTTFPLTFSMTNLGTVDLAADDYAIDFYLGTYSSMQGSKVGSVTFDGPLESMTSTTVEKTVSITVPESDYNQLRYIYAVETVGNKSVKVKQLSSYGYESDFSGAFVPYLPEVGVTGGGNKPLAQAFSMGRVEVGQKATRDVYVINTAGAAPLTVTGVSVTGGFSIEGESAFTVAAGGMKKLTLSYDATVAGKFDGTIKVTSAELDEFVHPLTVTVSPAGQHIFDFNADGKFPAGFVGDASAWQIEALPEVIASQTGDKAVTNSGFSSKMMISPVLKFTGDDPRLYFDVASRAGSGELKIYLSTDRLNWSEPIITVDRFQSDADRKLNLDATTTDYGSVCYFGTFSAPVPEGEWYVKFEGYGIYLDNIYGGERIERPVDVYVTSSSVPASATVNHEMLATMSVRNLGGEIAADSYSVELIIGGETACRAETPAIEKDEAVTFELGYTPHVPATTDALVRFTLGDYVIETPVSVLTIFAESAAEGHTVGNNDDYWYNFPVRPFTDKVYKSESVYPAELLGDFAAGDRISKLSWVGKTYRGEYTSLKVKVMLANTDDTETSSEFTGADALTTVLDGNLVIDRSITSADPMGDFATAVFDSEFVYTGGGLRVVVEVEPLESSDATDSYGVDSRYNRGCRYVSSTGSEEFGPLPVITLFRNLDVPSLGGVVTDAATGLPLEGAAVTLTSDNVVYSALTDADGAYNMPVYQHELEYSAIVTATGYFDFSAPEPVLFTDGDATLNAALNEAKVSVAGRLVSGGEPVAGISVSLECDGNEPQVADSDADGRFSFVTRNLGVAHTLTVESPLFAVVTRQVEVGMEDIDLGDIELVAGISVPQADAFSAVGGEGCIRLYGHGCKVTVADASGRVLITIPSLDGMRTVSCPGSGIYVVNNKKIMVK